MKIRKNLIFVSLLGVSLLGAALTAQAQDLPRVHFNVVGGFSTNPNFIDNEEPFWAKIISDASGGQVTAEIAAADHVGLAGPEIFDLVGRGVFDVGSMTMDYLSGQDARIEGLDMPAISYDIEAAHAGSSGLQPFLDQVMQETFNVKLLGVVPNTAQVMYCNGPISGIGDLKGKTIRGSGRTTLALLEALGSTGVSIAFSEVAIALDRGVMDCAITGSLSGYGARWWEVSSHLYPLPVGGWDHIGVVMNLDVWNNLDPRVQSFIEEQMEGFEERVWSAVAEGTQEGIACNTGGPCSIGAPGGMELVGVTDEELQVAARIVEEQVLPAWAGRVDAETVRVWNETMGEQFGVTATPQ